MKVDVLPVVSAPSRPVSILLIRTDKIGDVLISTPVFRALRSRFPDARIDVLLGRHNASMASALAGWTIGSYVYDKSLLGTIRLLLSLRRSHEVVVDMMDNPSRTSSILLRLLAPAFSVGFANGRTTPVTHSVPVPDRSRVHIVECMTELLRPFGIDPETVDRRPSLPGLPAVFAPASIDILVHLSAGKQSLWWGEENFRALVKDLRTQYPRYRIALGSAPADRSVAERVAIACGVDLLPSSRSVVEYAAHMAQARMIVTPDTSVVHLASAVHRPSVVLYAKPHADRMVWLPYRTPCRPVIATDDDGIRGIPVDRVTAAVTSLVAELDSGAVASDSSAPEHSPPVA